ncbi:MAG: CRISPR-associated helicase Cas3' [candidate division Zixibacteria bacterium]|nr:CRISPR-associated helicase Cas3' [candidate division Zixibacteria bacterium]
MLVDEKHLAIWAKLDRESLAWHPLLFHMIDVSAVVEALWHQSLTSSFKSLFRYDPADDSDMATTLAFWAALHDIGKATPGFQSRGSERKAHLSANGLTFPQYVDNIPHGTLSSRIIWDHFKPEYLAKGPKVALVLLKAASLVGGHHGRFPRANEIVDDRLSLLIGDTNWRTAQSNLILTISEKFHSKDRLGQTSALFSTNAAVMACAGLTSVADWIASNEDYFPFSHDFVGSTDDYLAQSRNRAAQALARLGWVGWKPAEEVRSFSDLFGKKLPRPLQRTLIKLAETHVEKSLYIIEAPMGDGKTEAALFLSNRVISSNGQRGMYIALPTQATSNQMFQRVREYLQSAYPDSRVNLHLLHGHSFFSEAYQSIRTSSVGDGPEMSVVASEWFLPKKRTLLSNFGVGTIDQSLLAVLQAKHFFVRLFGLAGKTIIFDEVHAYDTYMTSILSRLLEWLSALNCNVILLSATLPEQKKCELIQAFLGSSQPVPTAPYPAITQCSGGKVVVTAVEAASTKEVNLVWIDDDRSTLAKRIRRATPEGGKIAIICNTVSSAQQIYSLLVGSESLKAARITLFHARFLLRDRLSREQAVLNNFGSNSGGDGLSILVATQVIEQSLDLDFDLMITELAPADLVLQRMGRLHRRERIRSRGLDRAQLWIFSSPFDSAGLPTFGTSGFVYSPYILLRSFLVLQEKDLVKVPSDLKEIVERVYSDEDLGGDAHSPLRKKLEELHHKHLAELQMLQSEAVKRRIDPPSFPENILDRVFQELEDDDPEAHPARQALTRYGRESISIVCLQSERSEPDHPLLYQEPNFAQAKAMILDSVSVSQFDVVRALKGQETPSAWRHNPLTRSLKFIIFAQHRARIGDIEMVLDNDLGLIINRTK